MSQKVDRALLFYMKSDEIRKRANKQIMRLQKEINVMINDMKMAELESFTRETAGLTHLSKKELRQIKEIIQENVESLYREFKIKVT